ncbi:glycosyltransferase family protein [Hymenobacter tenuis]
MPPSLTILLASVLKPLDDTRMLGKFGRTLASRAGTQVHVAGRLAPTPSGLPDNLRTHALLAGSRLSFARVKAQWTYWQLLRKLRPNLVFVHAPELLPLTALWSVLGPNRRFVYDVRENYALNIQTQQVYPGWARNVLARLVRGLETLAARRATAIVLAERSYAEELPFAEPNRTLILENKYQPTTREEATPVWPRQLPSTSEPLRLLYSGTISELNGVWEAIRFARHLQEAWPLVHLTIIGACQQPGLFPRLEATVADMPTLVTLMGGQQLVPHARVVAEMHRSHLGLLPYQPHPSTARCIPTKLFEYLANGLPIVLPPNPLWQPLVQLHQAGIVLDFQQPEYPPAGTLAAMLAERPYYPQGTPPEALWATEAEKLHQLLDSIK